MKQFALQYCVVSTSTLSLSLPTGPQYCSLFSCFCEFIRKERTTIICLSFSNLFSIKKGHIPKKYVVRPLHMFAPKIVHEHCVQFLPKSIKKELCKILWGKQGLLWVI